MYDVGKFHNRVMELYRRATVYDGERPTQADLAQAIGLSRDALNKRLSPRQLQKLTERDVKAIVRTLTEWGVIGSRREAEELLALVDCPSFSAAEWAAPPLDLLTPAAPAAAPSSPVALSSLPQSAPPEAVLPASAAQIQAAPLAPAVSSADNPEREFISLRFKYCLLVVWWLIVSPEKLKRYSRHLSERGQQELWRVADMLATGAAWLPVAILTIWAGLTPEFFARMAQLGAVSRWLADYWLVAIMAVLFAWLVLSVIDDPALYLTRKDAAQDAGKLASSLIAQIIIVLVVALASVLSGMTIAVLDIELWGGLLFGVCIGLSGSISVALAGSRTEVRSVWFLIVNICGIVGGILGGVLVGKLILKVVIIGLVVAWGLLVLTLTRYANAGGENGAGQR